MPLIIAAAVLALAGTGALASSYPGINAQLPEPSCLAVAQAIVDDLQPLANKIAAKHIPLKVISGKPIVWTTMLHDSNSIVAEVNFDNAIVVHNLFCNLSPQRKAAAIAHEIGHVLDFNIDLTPRILRMPQTLFFVWKDRPMEQSANCYARQLVKMKGGDPGIVDQLFE